MEAEATDACVSAVSNACLALRFVSCHSAFCFPLVSFLCSLSLCLQEEGVVSFCKVCALGLVNSPFHHLPNDMSKHAPPTPPPTHVLPATPHAPMLLTPCPLPLPKTPLAACATEHTESELPIMPLGGPLLTIAGTLGIVAQPTQSHFYF